MSGIRPEQRMALAAAVEADPAAAVFAALAEVHRLDGRLGEAEEVARRGLDRKPEATEGRLVLALALLDQGRIAEARDELERLAAGVLASHGISTGPDAGDSLSEAELDDAFESAETDTDELIDPNRVAEAAVARVDAGAEEGLDDADAAGAIEPGSAFATATMADLLERQGDEGGARRIRASLGAAPGASSESFSEPAPEHDERQYWIQTLEGWLSNLRGDRS